MADRDQETNRRMTLRRRLHFRSWHRGTKEMDHLLGRFADDGLNGLSEAQLESYDALLSEPDPDLYNWITGREDPADTNLRTIVQILRDFHGSA